MRQSCADTLAPEEPDELMAHVRVCGGAGWVTIDSTRKPTPNSFRSCVASAIARGSPRPFGIDEAVAKPVRIFVGREGDTHGIWLCYATTRSRGNAREHCYAGATGRGDGLWHHRRHRPYHLSEKYPVHVPRQR